MSTPQIRVRLSPEGVADVIEALRRVTAESKAAQANAGKGVGLVSTAVRELKALLPALGLAAIVGGFAALSAQALKTADATGKLQQKVGGTTEEISGLTLAFRQNESTQEGLQQALLKTIQVMGQVRAGSQEAADALSAVGLNPQEIANQTSPRALESIARALIKIEEPAKRAAAAQKIFGKQTGDLLIALNAVGEKGIDGFIARAKELGVLIDDDLATAAARARDALFVVKLQAEGLATQFQSGLAPAVADAMESFSDSVSGGGVNGMRIFGQAVGFVLRAVVGAFETVGQTIAAVVKGAVIQLTLLKEVIAGAFTLDGTRIKEAFEKSVRDMVSLGTGFAKDVSDNFTNLIEGPKKAPPRPTGGDGSGGVDPEEQLELLRKNAAARLALRQQQLEAEAALQKEYLESEESANKIAYDQGLVSLATYYQKRRELVERGLRLELDAARGQRQLLVQQLNTSSSKGGPADEQTKIRLRQQIAAIDAQILQAQVKGARELAVLDAERIAAVKDLTENLQDQNAKLLELEGARHAAFLANMDGEIRKIRELGAKAGQTADEIEAQVQRLIGARTASFNFDEAARAGAQALAAFDRDADQIRRDQQAGIITQLEGEERLIQLEEKRLALLQQLSAEMLKAAQATNNQDLINQAQQFASSVDQIAASYKQATDIATRFRSAGVSAFQEGIESLANNITKIKSFGDAFWTLAKTVGAALSKIASEIIARQTTLALLNLIPGGAGGFLGFLKGGKDGGRIRGYDAGGTVGGPRLPIPGPDKTLILAQDGEFMVKRRVATAPGMYAFLHKLNAGLIKPMMARALPRFADGGVIGNGSMMASDVSGFGGSAGRRDVHQHFHYYPDRQGNVSTRTVMQTTAAAAAGLAEADGRNN